MVVASSLLYFYCGAGTIALCIMCYFWLSQMELFKRCVRFGLSPASRAACSSGLNESSNLLSARAAPTKDARGYQALRTDVEAAGINPRQDSVGGSHQSSHEFGFDTRYAVLRTVLPAISVVFLVFFTTLALWPALGTYILCNI